MKYLLVMFPGKRIPGKSIMAEVSEKNAMVLLQDANATIFHEDGRFTITRKSVFIFEKRMFIVADVMVKKS